MINVEKLKKHLLSLAFEGKLTIQDDREIVDNLINNLFKGNQKKYVSFSEELLQFAIPANWKWCMTYQAVSLDNGIESKGLVLPYLDVKYLRNKINPELLNNGIIVDKGSKLILVDGENSGEVFQVNEKGYKGSTLKILNISKAFIDEYIFYFILSHKDEFRKNKTGAAIPHLDKKMLFETPIPLPPLEEQKRIVAKLDDIFTELNKINVGQNKLISLQDKLEDKLLDLAIQGKLVEQRSEEGTGEELFNTKCRNIKNDIKPDEIPFELPENWKWIRLGWTMEIERGGSPRPIKSFITDCENGINWIKIGDVDKGGKYIYKTSQKIKPEGESKSRRVYPGDFLLTNSMSFGRPYISKITGCIHDGWLLLRNSYGVFDLDYLYLLLSSKFAFNQFSQKASGATVDNLNKDKVAISLVPLPPLEEQKRIVAKLEELLPKIRIY